MTRLGVAAALVGGRLVAGDVAVADGRVEAIGLAGRGRGIAAPGFVDLHVNGFAGVDFLIADRAGYERAEAALRATGTTAYRPTFVTASERELAAALRGLPDRRRVLGAHLEGPFLAPGRLGAHDPERRRDPDPALLGRLLDAGRVSQVTLAPELPGAFELVDLLRARGVVAAAGHTDATAAQAHAAFDRGVETVVHLFNAMRPPAAREPGLALAALAHGGVTVQLIADGHHVADDALVVAWRAAPGRVALVTDAVAAAGAGDGESTLGGRPVVSAGGVVRDGAGRLAGSALTMIGAVRNVHALGVPLEQALAAATEIPARIARRRDVGRLEPGAPADVVILDDGLEIVRVLVDGR